VVEGAQGGYRTVAVLLGAAQGLRETVGGTVHGYYKPDEALRAATVRAARSALGADGFEDAVDEGRALEPSQVVELAVTTPAPRLRLASSTPGAA
jgi:hypothetical protein